MTLRLLFVAAVLLPAARPLEAWGPDGHRIVAQIAFGQLNERAKAQVAQLLQPGETLDSIASWADAVRPQRPETGPWHYVNIPVAATRKLGYADYCPAQGCVIRRIDELIVFLKSGQGTRIERAEALKFLVHFIGDMHQPLHCGDNKDRGGNDVRVMFDGAPSNLHSIWDVALVSRMLAKRPDFEGSPLRGTNWWSRWRTRKGSVEDWAWQAHGLSRDVAYGKLPAARPVPIDDAYIEGAIPVIAQQVQRGGLRLGKVLNEIWP